MQPILTKKQRRAGERALKRIIDEYDLEVLQVFRNGPRFFVALCQMGVHQVIFKTCFNPLRADPFPNHGLKKEILALRYFSTRPHQQFTGLTPRVFWYGLGSRRWYIREHLVGQPQNVPGSNFIFLESFFTPESIDWFVRFFGQIHRLSRWLPPSLRHVYVSHNLKTNMDLIGWYKLPHLIDFPHITERVRYFLSSHEQLFDNHQRVLTHYEPYASHFFKCDRGTFFVIDWENIDFGTAAHDLSVLWARGALHPYWQHALLKKFYRQTAFKKHFWDLFEIEALLHSINNIDYFLLTSHPAEKRLRPKLLPFFRRMVIRIISGKFQPDSVS